MIREKLIIQKQKELIKNLKFCWVPVTKDQDEVVKAIESELITLESEQEQRYEPYMGWCDVEDCENEASSGGVEWKNTGYWMLCMDHSRDARGGKIQPKMKQSAIEREYSRDKVTGFLPITYTKQ